MSTEQITVADGKYQVFHERGKLWALRNGEPWSRDITGDNLIYWMMMRILELEAAQPTLANGLTEAETSATASVMGLSNPGELPGMWHESDLIGGETDCTPAQATQAEVTDELLRPEDFNVEVVMKPVGGFAPVRTQGVRVTHKPTGISVTCDAARSQHTNRHHAFEQLREILALRPSTDPMLATDIKPRRLSYPLDTYHRAPGDGALNATWQDKPHRLLYDLIAAVAYYAQECNRTHPAPGVPDDVVRVKLTPLTDAQMEKGREQIFSVNNPYCPCDRKTFKKVAQWVEAHHAAMLTAAQEQKGQP